MGRARALKLGITKGIQTVARVTLPQTMKCPICKYQFTAYEVAVEAKSTGISAEEIVGSHIEQCIRARFPGKKSQCFFCHKDFTIDELREHVEKEHPE